MKRRRRNPPERPGLPQTFRSAYKLRAWLRRSRAALPAQLYARVDPWLTLHDSPTLPKYTGLQFWPLDRPLPPPEDVQAWWDRLMEETIVDVYVIDHELVCAACVAVWEALPQLHLGCDKAAFRRLRVDEAEALLGEEFAWMMIQETRHLGISVRPYPMPPVAPAPAAAERAARRKGRPC